MMPSETFVHQAVMNANMESSNSSARDATDVGRWTLDSMLDARCCTSKVFMSCQPWTHNFTCFSTSASQV